MSMLEAIPETSGLPRSYDAQEQKIVILSCSSPESATFSIKDEDHTLGNALRYMITQNPHVEFCGYSIPHPSEFKIHLRIQTDSTLSAVEALNKGLNDLTLLCQEIQTKFKEAVSDYKNQ